MRRLIKKFYMWCGADDEVGSELLSWFTFVGLIIFFLARVGNGMVDANSNDHEHCVVSSIDDVILSPAYALGCNLAKKRFEIKLN